MKQEENKTCEQRIEANFMGRMSDLEVLVQNDVAGSVDSELGYLDDYGLSFDYVAPETFDGQPEGYFRYQLSYGGPSDEIRFFVNPDFSCHRIEYWFMDWFDGAHHVCDGLASDLMHQLWDLFREREMIDEAMKNARR